MQTRSASGRGATRGILGACLVALAAVAVAAPAARARGFSRPVRLAGSPVEAAAPLVAFTPAGTPAVAMSFFDPGRQHSGRAYLSLLAPGHAPSTQAVGGEAQVLALRDYAGELTLLVEGPAGRCCSYVRLRRLGSHGLDTGRVLARGAGGPYLGALVPAGRGILAAIADLAGVWVAQARSDLRFGSPHRLTPAAAAPQSLAGAALSGARTLLAWAAATVTSGGTFPASAIATASGGATRIPGPVRQYALAAGDQLDELALADGPRVPALAWVQDFYDAQGSFETQVVASDYASTLHPVVLDTGGVFSGLSAAADGAGDELLAWKSCDPTPVCRLMVASRRAGRRFGAPVALGAIDAGTDPAVVVGAGGGAMAAWVQRGQLTVARQAAAGGRFGRAETLRVGGAQAVSVALAAGPRGRMLAAWTERGAGSSVYAALFTP